MALEVTFFFSSFLSLNLCMSLWFHCSHTAVQRQSYTKRWNEKAFWGDIESQVISTPGSSTELKCFFPLFWIASLFPDAVGNEDVEMASQNPGTVQLQAKAPEWTGRVWFRVIVSVQERAHIDLTLISSRDGNCTSWVTCGLLLWFSLQLSLIKDLTWSVLLAAEEYEVYKALNASVQEGWRDP